MRGVKVPVFPLGALMSKFLVGPVILTSFFGTRTLVEKAGLLVSGGKLRDRRGKVTGARGLLAVPAVADDLGVEGGVELDLGLAAEAGSGVRHGGLMERGAHSAGGGYICKGQL